MDLGSFPEDHRIPVTALIDMWMELYKLVEDRYAIVNLNDLSNRNLVNLVITRYAGYIDLCVVTNCLCHFIGDKSRLEVVRTTRKF